MTHFWCCLESICVGLELGILLPQFEPAVWSSENTRQSGTWHRALSECMVSFDLGWFMRRMSSRDNPECAPRFWRERGRTWRA